MYILSTIRILLLLKTSLQESRDFEPTMVGIITNNKCEIISNSINNNSLRRQGNRLFVTHVNQIL